MERIIPLYGIVRVEGVGGGGGGMVVIDYDGIGRHSWKVMSVGCVRTHRLLLHTESWCFDDTTRMLIKYIEKRNG